RRPCTVVRSPRSRHRDGLGRVGQTVPLSFAESSSARRPVIERNIVKASVFIGTSLDGFIARPNGAFDFLDHGGNEPHGFEEFFAWVGRVCTGRKTWQRVLPFAAGPSDKKPVFVPSSSPLALAPFGAVVEPLSGDPAAIVAQLAARGIR